MSRIAILGAGAWGTALALVVGRAGHVAVLCPRRPEQAAAIGAQRENRAHLPGIRLDPMPLVTADAVDAFDAAALAIAACPLQALRAELGRIAHAVPVSMPLVLAAKGIETGTGALPTEVVGEVLPGRPVAVLSGPTLAWEVAQDLPTAVTIASAQPGLAALAATMLSGPRFRPYAAFDPVGAEVGGALKNVVAIACGIAAGLGLGENARAALMTRGLAEMVRLGTSLGARPETFLGLSGLGDLDLTCNAARSRNFSFGLELGRGGRTAEILAGRSAVTEGVATAPAALLRAARAGIELPIAAAVAEVLSGAPVVPALERLLARPLRAEQDP